MRDSRHVINVSNVMGKNICQNDVKIILLELVTKNNFLTIYNYGDMHIPINMLQCC